MTDTSRAAMDETLPTPSDSRVGEVPHRLYVEHLQQRLAQSDVLRDQVFDLEREVVFLQRELQFARSTVEASEQARARDAERCATDHVDRARYRKAKRQVRELERELRQLRASRVYRLARRLSALARRAAPASGSLRPATGAAPRTRTRTRTREAAPNPAKATTTGPTSLPTPADSGGTVATQPRSRPAVLVDGRGLDGRQLATALTYVKERTGDAVVVVAQDSLDFRPARERGMRIEYIPDERTLTEAVGAKHAATIVGRRWGELLTAHQPTEIHRATAPDSTGDATTELVWFSTTEHIR